MDTPTVADLVATLRTYRILSPEQLDALGNQALPADPRAAARLFMQRGWLTNFQVNELFAGRGAGLLLKNWVLLDTLGEGGMGQVYKARNWKLGQIVAVKVIRKERLTNDTSIKRFHKEIRAAAKLHHPNIVRALDADEDNGVHFFVMEYVEGADLHKLVKTQGPLEIRQACDFIRQAALGLQHALEHGLVHRDIKPHNLFLTMASLIKEKVPTSGSSAGSNSGILKSEYGLVKILDMGLARSESEADGDQSSTMTQEGAVMGTPDYIAPEQGLNSRDVDIRADLYSLGCTLYFLVTGQAPFSGGTMMEKLIKHQTQMPTPLSLIRPETPQDVEAITFKLLAKRPNDRYQTPLELVRDLTAFLNGEPLPPMPLPSTVGLIAPPRDDSASLADSALQFSDSSTPVLLDVRRPKVAPPRRKGLIVGVVGGAFVLVGLIGMAIVFLRPDPHKETKSEATTDKDPKKPVVAKSNLPLQQVEDYETWLDKVKLRTPTEQAKAVESKLRELNFGFTGNFEPEIADGAVVGVKFSSDTVADIDPLRAFTKLKRLECPGSQPGKGQLQELRPLSDMKLTRLVISNNKIVSIGPLRGMPLDTLLMSNNAVGDFNPLEKMPLTTLNAAQTRVNNIAALKGAPLQTLILTDCPVNNLGALSGMNTLVTLLLNGTQVADLAPLRGLQLELLDIRDTYVPDFKSLKDIPLRGLMCDFSPTRDIPALKALNLATTINEKPVSAFWTDVERNRVEFEKWRTDVAAWPGAKQIDAVTQKLQELNPAFTERISSTRNPDGTIASLTFPTNKLANLAPLAALTSLRALDCAGTSPGQGKLIDLTPIASMKLARLNIARNRIVDLVSLADMPLTELQLQENRVTDLKPLEKMPLEKLICDHTPVKSLAPLKGRPLKFLDCHNTPIDDLTPLKGAPLTHLSCSASNIASLAPLRKMPLTELWIQNIRTYDLTPLAGLPLKTLSLDFVAWRDSAAVRALPQLERVNGRAVSEYTEWADWEESVRGMKPSAQLEAVRKKLVLFNPKINPTSIVAEKENASSIVELWVLGNECEQIAPVRAIPGLETLYLGVLPGNTGSSKLWDLIQLRGLKLKKLSLHGTKVTNLTPLTGMELQHLILSNTTVNDLRPLAGMPIEELWLDHNSNLSSIEALRELRQLKKLVISNDSKLNNLKGIESLPLEYLDCKSTKLNDLNPLKQVPTLREFHGTYDTKRDKAVFQALPNLELINGKPPPKALKTP